MNATMMKVSSTLSVAQTRRPACECSMRPVGLRTTSIVSVPAGLKQNLGLRRPSARISKTVRNFKIGNGMDETATKVSPVQPAFTRRREVFVGRLAMVGFLSACIGEIITGRGALGQLNLYTPLSSPMVDALALGLVVYSALGALNPLSPTFSDENQRDIKKRPRGPTNDPTMYPGEPKKFMGITNFGFTKKNELFVGRVAMLGFAFAIIGEKLTGGKGPLAQIGIPLGQPLNPTYAGLALAVWIGFFGLAAIGYNNFGQTDGDEGIY